MSNNAARYQQRTEGSTRKNTRKEKAAVACDAGTLAEVKEKYRQERLERVQKLSPKNEHQSETIEAFKDKQLIIQSGSAGVGKTELACWWASKLWLEGKIDTIVITRPHKHLGDDYGAVKGSDAEKLLPFCMSILMKLRKHLGVGTLRNNFKMDRLDDLFGDAKGIVIVPIEKIQGLSYDSRTIIIGDEIQSASVSQVKALATRMEEGCQLLLCGDKLQSAISGINGLEYLEQVLVKHPHDLAQVISYTPDDNCRKGITAHLTRAFEAEGSWEQQFFLSSLRTAFILSKFFIEGLDNTTTKIYYNYRSNNKIREEKWYVEVY